jgi:heat shock protein HslJ
METMMNDDQKLTVDRCTDRVNSNGLNRITGTINLETLSTTMMARALGKMRQEKAFWDILDDVDTVELMDDGRLLMKTNEGETLVAA